MRDHDDIITELNSQKNDVFFALRRAHTQGVRNVLGIINTVLPPLYIFLDNLIL